MEQLQEISFTHKYWILLLPLLLMAADIVTGWIQATINSNWDSTKMRKGLFRKSAEISVILVAYIIDLAIQLPVDIPAFISGYIAVMEILSVCENLSHAGLPVPTWIIKRLKKAAEDMTNDDPIGPVDEIEDKGSGVDA